LPAVQPETRYARSKDGHVAYQVVGDGPLDLVFIPSWTSNVDAMWEEASLARFLRRLATFSRLICFDKRGSGVSDTVPLAALPTLEQWSDDVRTVMQAAGSKRAALLGHSVGGQMAMLFAATHPEQTSALILVDSRARAIRDVEYPWGLPVDPLPLLLEDAGRLWGTGGNLDFIAPSVSKDERFRRWYARYERLAMRPGAVPSMFAAELERDLRGVLPAIRVPTLILHRAGNRYIQVGHGRYLAEHIPGAKYVELAGDDHLFHVGETDQMLGEVEEFLTGVRPVAGERPCARHRPVHRHRHLDRTLGPGRRPEMEGPPRPARRPHP
jgi:pimeloyl-ACP methyl ester carboxylesterase